MLRQNHIVLDVAIKCHVPTFGMSMPGRKWQASDYRYGYEQQESDDEVQGDGNLLAFEYRMTDPRLGRFWSVDPLAYNFPWNSPYAFSENRVTNAIELEGLEALDLGTTEGNVNHEAGVSGPNQEARATINGPFKDVTSAINGFNSGSGSGAIRPGSLTEVTVKPHLDIPMPLANKSIDLGLSCHDSRDLHLGHGSLFDRLFNTGQYGTGTGGQGGFSNAKYMDDMVAKIAEMLAVMKPSNKTQINSPVPMVYDKGAQKGLKQGRKELYTHGKETTKVKTADDVNDNVKQVQQSTIYYTAKGGKTETSTKRDAGSKTKKAVDSLQNTGNEVRSYTSPE